MCRCSKKRWMKLTAIVLALTVQTGKNIAYAQEEPSTETMAQQLQLYEEGTGFYIPYMEGRARLYDSHGNFCSILSLYDNFFFIPTIDLNSVLVREESDRDCAYRVRDGKVIYEAAHESKEILALKDSFLVYDPHTGLMELYDNEGKIFYSGPEKFPEGAEIYHSVEHLTQGCLIDCHSRNYTTCPFSSSYYLYVDDETHQTTRLDKDVFGSSSYDLINFGTNILVRGDSEDSEDSWSLKLLDLEGNCIYDNIEDYGDRIFSPRDFYCPLDADHIYIRDGETYLELNEQLEVTDEITFPGNTEPEMSYENYYVGAAYQSLNWQICAGSVAYNDERRVPYVEEAGGIRVYAPEENFFIPVPENFRVESVNHSLAILRSDMPEYSDYYFVINYRTGEYVYNDPDKPAEWKKGNAELNKDYCLISFYDNGISSYSVLDNEGTLSFSADSPVRCMASCDSYLYMSRGPYCGFIDTEGNWVFKILREYSD